MPRILHDQHDVAMTAGDVDLARWLLEVVPREHRAELENRWPAVVIVGWADAQKQPLCWERIAGKFNVSRATAYRWIAILRGPTYGRRARRPRTSCAPAPPAPPAVSEISTGPTPPQSIYRAPSEAFGL